jgi:DNA-binding MarR family transcriptional regulator
MLGFDPATVSRAVKRLMDADMIEGSQDNRDTRMIRLTLTERGIDIAEQYEDLSARAFMAVNSRLTSGLTSTEKVALLSAMEKMLQRSTLLSGLRLEDDIFEAQEPLRVRKAAPGR